MSKTCSKATRSEISVFAQFYKRFYFVFEVFCVLQMPAQIATISHPYPILCAALPITPPQLFSPR